MIYDVTIPGHVVPKARPRVGKGRTYMPSAYQACRARLMEWIIAQDRPEITDADVSVDLLFYHSGRGDIDNLAGTVLEVLQGFVYNDDAQVRELHTVIIRSTKAEEKTEIKVSKLNGR